MNEQAALAPIEGAADYVLKDNLVRLPIAIKQAIANAKEIESNKQLSMELEFSEQIFNAFMEHSPIYVFFKDSTIRAIRLSKNYETMLGKPMHELIGKNIDDLFPSELAKNMIADDSKIIKEDVVVTVEEEFNGRFYSTIKFPIHIKGKGKYLAGFTIDITESIQNERLLNEKMEEMLNFHKLTVNRELIMIELKKEVNLLLKAFGEDDKYKIVE
jgi:PAS domain S-box-containing protein